MTIVFQGRITALSTVGAPIGKLRAELATPMSDTTGEEWIVFVPNSSAAKWLPGRIVCFTIYAMDSAPKEKP